MDCNIKFVKIDKFFCSKVAKNNLDYWIVMKLSLVDRTIICGQMLQLSFDYLLRFGEDQIRC